MIGKLISKLFSPKNGLHAFILVTSAFFILLTVAVYLVLGILSLLMYFLPWAP
jgi:hypothetical protein